MTINSIIRLTFIFAFVEINEFVVTSLVYFFYKQSPLFFKINVLYVILIVGFIVLMLCGIKILYDVIEYHSCYNLPVNDFYKHDECIRLLEDLEE